MVNIKKFKKEDVKSYLNGSYGLICFSSFEERCLTVPYAVASCNILKVFILSNIGINSVKENQINAELIRSVYHEAEVIEIDIDNSVAVANNILEIINQLMASRIENLLVDISTFTHEVLLIMLRLLYENNKFQSINCMYNGASDYSIGDQPEQVWLSKGCRDVRNVIGYPGVLKPSQKNHLIILAGFEVERATRLVELLEPDILTLGDGIEPTDIKHEESMKYFREKFATWKNTFQNAITNTFNFSCCDIEKTIILLNDVINKELNINYILVPLNTKLSTLAVGMVALSHTHIQVCYAIPEMYNTSGYSKPSDNITVVDLNSFEQFKNKK